MFHKKFMKKLESALNKLEGLIGIARKAGFVIVGGDNLSTYTKKLYLVIIDKTAGTSLKRQMGYVAKDRQIPLYETENLGSIVGIGLLKGGRSIKYKVLLNIVLGWIATPLIAGLTAYILLFVVGNIFQLQVCG